MSSFTFERLSPRFIRNPKSDDSTLAFGFLSKLFLDKNSFLSRAQVPSTWSVDVVLTFLLTNEVLSAIMGPIYATIIYELLYIYEIFLFILPCLMRSVLLLVISGVTLQHLLHDTRSIQFIVSTEILMLNSSIFFFIIFYREYNLQHFQFSVAVDVSIYLWQPSQRHIAFYRAFFTKLFTDLDIQHNSGNMHICPLLLPTFSLPFYLFCVAAAKLIFRG